jgi:hypothetical protein
MSGILEWKYIMHIFLSGLLALALVVHALFGCCWHHAHSDSPCDHVIAAAVAPADCCEHPGTPVDGNPPNSPGNHQRDCQGVCTYLPAQKTQLDLPTVFASIDLVATPTGSYGGQDFAPGVTGVAHHPPSFEPPLRLHLLHRQLLI